MIFLMLQMLACTTETNELPPFASHTTDQQNSDDVPDFGDTEDSGEVKPDTGVPESPTTDVCDGRQTGTEIGMCAQNFELLDKNQELVTLHQFSGDVIFIDLSSPG